MLLAQQPSLFTRLTPAISRPRLEPFLQKAGFDEDKAVQLYGWNADLGAALHPTIQAAEVGLRNRIDQAFRAVYGPDWWRNPAFRRAARPRALIDIDEAAKRIARKGRQPATDDIVAGLSFGFWVGLLAPAYNPAVWSHQLRAVFIGLPATARRGDVYEEAGAVAWLRNRIDHHEPILGLDLSKRHADLLTFLGWICPNKMAWARGRSRLPAVLRSKP